MYYNEIGFSPGLNEKFRPAETHLRVVRLLLDKESRSKFEELVNTKIFIASKATINDKNEKLRETYDKIEKEIQNILEKHLSYSTF